MPTPPPFKHEYKEPDEIIIESNTDHAEQSTEQETLHGENQKLYTNLYNKSPFLLRLFCVVGCAVSLIYAIFLLFLSVITLFTALFTLFQNTEINRSIKTLWQKYTKALLIGFGFALGILNPSLGFRYLFVWLS